MIFTVRIKLYASLLLVLAWMSPIVAQQRLLVAGGGKRPAEAIRKFADWAGGDKARILIVTWASGVPEESFAGLNNDFARIQTASIEHAPIAPLDAAERAKFLEQLSTATGVFFSGGDQNRIMDVLGDSELLKIILTKYHAGIPFGGTSAGAAAMSDPMMTGEADLKIIDGTKVGVRKGIGFVPEVIFDQHFLVRQRHNRLFSLIIKNAQTLGIGIDEDTAVLISDSRYVEVFGGTQVMFVDGRNRKGSMMVSLLKSGERFDLKKRKRIERLK
ncbi:MAG: cyanophycinase [Saprospiraceae bacterium]|nr:cyanophycinase [Pyrinomonadaceae bacterium]